MGQESLIYCQKCGSILPNDLRSGSLECLFCHAVYSIKQTNQQTLTDITCPFCHVKNPAWKLTCDNCRTVLQDIELLPMNRENAGNIPQAINSQKKERAQPLQNPIPAQSINFSQPSTPVAAIKPQIAAKQKLNSSTTQNRFAEGRHVQGITDYEAKIKKVYQFYKQYAIHINRRQNKKFVIRAIFYFVIIYLAFFWFWGDTEKADPYLFYTVSSSVYLLLLLYLAFVGICRKILLSRRISKNNPGFDIFFKPTIKEINDTWPDELTPALESKFLAIILKDQLDKTREKPPQASSGLKSKEINTTREQIRHSAVQKNKQEESQIKTLVCPRCGGVLPDYQRVALIQCPICSAKYNLSGGKLLPSGSYICPKCFRTNPVSAKNCSYCGRSMYHDVYERFTNVLMQHVSGNVPKNSR